MEAFVRLNLDRLGCHLALVGPDVSGISDDPEGQAVLAAVLGHLLDAPRAVTDGMGRRARARVRAEFLDDRQLLDWAALFDVVLAGHQAA